ncbi:uncharacterized protein [Rutidosis leptorrhynchoides]|uniref:uncharacterized protein n=1 Tax=Rutidosis leptorrhynchoides TaxID=125765 RepID=UPI003A98F994
MTDNGTEFVNHQCHDLFASNGIMHQKTYPYNPQQNGVVEKKYRHIREVARALRQIGYILYNLTKKVFLINMDVTFHESVFPFATAFSVPLSHDHISSLIDHDSAIYPSLSLDPSLNPHFTEIPLLRSLPHMSCMTAPVPLRVRPARHINPPVWMKDYSTACAYPIQDSIQYSRVMPAYQSYIAKIDSIPEPYKARLVAKGFKQKAGVDYKETFPLVVKMVTVRSVVTLAATFNWSLYQMDVYNAFLHRDLEEEVFMTITEGLCNLGGDNMVCKLHKSLYSLKQASRQWNHKITTALTQAGYS